VTVKLLIDELVNVPELASTMLQLTVPLVCKPPTVAVPDITAVAAETEVSENNAFPETFPELLKVPALTRPVYVALVPDNAPVKFNVPIVAVPLIDAEAAVSDPFGAAIFPFAVVIVPVFETVTTGLVNVNPEKVPVL